MKYTLTATELKNGKTLYQVINEDGKIVAKRTSARKYVACTINGEMFFGRLDLIGKGEHGNRLNYIADCKYNTTIERYSKIVAERVRETRMAERAHLATWLRYTPVEKQNAPMDAWMYEHLVTFCGKDVADSCKTQKDYQIASSNEERAIERLMKSIGTFEDWKKRREDWLAENENTMDVCYLAR